MSDHNDLKPTHTSASGKDAAAHDDDFLDSTIDSDDSYESRDQTFGQDTAMTPCQMICLRRATQLCSTMKKNKLSVLSG